MLTGAGQMNMFLYSGMTPRAWRMIAYCCIGILLYGSVVLAEIVQNFQLNQVDSNLRQAGQIDALEEIDSPAPYQVIKSTL